MGVSATMFLMPTSSRRRLGEHDMEELTVTDHMRLPGLPKHPGPYGKVTIRLIGEFYFTIEAGGKPLEVDGQRFFLIKLVTVICNGDTPEEMGLLFNVGGGKYGIQVTGFKREARAYFTEQVQKKNPNVKLDG